MSDLGDVAPIYGKIQGHLNREEIDVAARMANELLNEDPKDSIALFMFAQAMNAADKRGVAYNLYQQVVHYSPKLAEAWNNLGGTLKYMGRNDEMERHFMKSMKLDPKAPHPYNNMGVIRVEQKRPEEALEYCQKAIEIDPKDPFNYETRSFARLMLGDWGGFDDYEACLHTGTRLSRAYGPEPAWNGEKGKTVIIHTEQGLGDEIMFAQLFERAIKDCKKVVIDCDPRVKGLFKRSFPNTEVHGTRHQKEGIEWLDGLKPDYHCAAGSLYRLYKDKWNTGRFLVPDENRKKAFSSLLSKDKPNIGLAWRGGKLNTGSKKRSFTLDIFKDIMKQDANFVSLEYMPVNEGIDHFPWITEKGVDYDNAMALVDCLDLIISVPTTIVHAAGALGKECWVITPHECNWRFQKEGESMPFHDSLKLYRQSEAWADTIKEVERDLNGYIESFYRARS
ncbi:MAG: tetratricopeptide repeat protein [Candidatus Dadabacteria bacterium]|nr:tetratricopeptide repeat protein [Candidatus Dadabacteria bacterium]